MGNVSNLLPCLEFFRIYEEALKQVTVNLCRTDVLHHCNRLWSDKCFSMFEIFRQM